MSNSITDLRLQLLAHHYTHSVPSGKSWYYEHDGAIVVYSIPANPSVSRFLLGVPNRVIELARLWAPDGHRPNLMTEAIAWSVKQLARDTSFDALVSYADPSVGHLGGVYRAASWVYLGQCEETRAYRDAASGAIVARRKFHSGNRSLRKAEIEARGFVQVKLPGKHRFARGMTRDARRRIEEKRA